MRSFFARFIPVFVLLSILLFQLKPVHAQWNPFSGMSAGEAARTTGGFLWDSGLGVRVSPIGVLYDTIAGNERQWDYTERTSVDPETGRTLTRNTVGEQLQSDTREALGIPTGGSITDALTARLIGFLAYMMGIIVSFLGKVISLLINILLGFLTYNGFADAPPVVIGWKIVRDLVNMFFIVILILSSYATILGWKEGELHVKKVLPKVLLAAVLVNFSKTIVALLIDASQVVMLTFVNAFAAIGAGNFTNALHLPLIAQSGYADQLQAAVSSTAQSVATNGAGQVIIDVILASALQIFLLIVAIGVMLMMVVFVVARIVGLWMLLIFSPIPFLAEALPGSMKKAMPGVDDFWPRLTGLLTGGPIMAFWLWLTFATLSAQNADERLGLFTNNQAASYGAAGAANAFQVGQDVTSAFITRIGNAQGLGSYIIAIAMMMMGLEAALKAADSVKETGGGLMKKIGEKSKRLASRAAIGVGAAPFAVPLLAGGAVGYGAFKGGRAGVGLVDRKYDLSGKMARTIGKFPGLRENKWLNDQKTAVRDANIKRAAEKSKILNDPYASAEDKAAEYKRIQTSYGMFGSDADKRVMREAALANAGNEKAFDKELKPAKEAVKASTEAAVGDKVVAKRVSDRAGKQQSNGKRLAEYEEAKKGFDENSQEAEAKRLLIDEATKKINKENPHLITNEEERKKQMAEVRQNFSSLDQDAKANFEVLKNFAADGAFKTDPTTGKVSIGDAAAIRATQKKLNGNDRKNFDALVSYVKESPSGVDTKTLGKLSVEQDANDQRRIFQAETDGTGKITGGKFVISETRQAEVDKVTKNFSAADQGTWMPGGEVTTAKAGELKNAAKTVGVSQVVQNVGTGASASAAPAMRAAAVSSIAASTGAGLQAANTYLNKKRDYPDATGANVSRTNAEILRDKNVPVNVRARAVADYESQLNEVLPILNGMEELSSDEQIEFMAAMGENNVGQALNSAMITNPNTKAATKNLQIAVNANAEPITEYLDSLPEETKQGYDDFRVWTEYAMKNPSSDPNVQKNVEEFTSLQKADDEFRAAYFKETPGAERAYNDYVRSESARARVEPKSLRGADREFDKKYSKYVKYDNARSAINQFNNSGGKGSGSGYRQRGERTPRAPKP